MNNTHAGIVDVFSSVQGEGIFLGAKQVFVRFERCNLKCSYCDEPRDATAEVYTPPALLEKILFLEEEKGSHHSVSLTGGEPLCYSDFLAEFLPLLRAKGMKSYLETNGTLAQELGRIIDLVDIIAMDIKLPSATGAGAFWDAHTEFLKTALKKRAFVKVVVTPEVAEEDIEKAIRLVTSCGTNIPFILQPATLAASTESAVDKKRLLDYLEMGMRGRLETIKVIPQMHKAWGVK
jgi:organic radical activating enzyme